MILAIWYQLGKSFKINKINLCQKITTKKVIGIHFLKIQINNIKHLNKMKKEKIKVIGGKNNTNHMIIKRLRNIAHHFQQVRITRNRKIINLSIKSMLHTEASRKIICKIYLNMLGGELAK